MVWTFFALHRKNSTEQLSYSQGIQARVGTVKCLAQGFQFTLPGAGLHRGTACPSTPRCLKGNTEPPSRNRWSVTKGLTGARVPL